MTAILGWYEELLFMIDLWFLLIKTEARLNFKIKLMYANPLIFTVSKYCFCTFMTYGQRCNTTYGYLWALYAKTRLGHLVKWGTEFQSNNIFNHWFRMLVLLRCFLYGSTRRLSSCFWISPSWIRAYPGLHGGACICIDTCPF